MTHEELLADINEYVTQCEEGIRMEGERGYKALRAVVELHKPCRIDNDMTYCEGCSNSAFFPWKYCPTIQAIEKALS